VQNGKIARIGKGLTAPAGGRTIDATGKFVTPGIIDCHSHAMVSSINEGSYSVTSMVRIRDMLDPSDMTIYRALAGGVTGANLLHGSANSIGGRTRLLNSSGESPLKRWSYRMHRRVSSSRWRERPAYHAAGASRCSASLSATRQGTIEVMRDAFSGLVTTSRRGTTFV